VFMRNGVSGKGPAAEKSCCSASDSRDAARVAAKLGMPFYAVDYAAEFGRIIDHFVAEYARGRTPNPCVLCNQDLKFGHLLRVADDVGAWKVATGHYARVEDGKLIIDQEGRIAKFVEKVDQVSFSGRRAVAQGQDVTYVTERCVVELRSDGLTVTEIAPGIDLERDVLAQAKTTLRVAPDLRQMQAALFRPDLMGLEL